MHWNHGLYLKTESFKGLTIPHLNTAFLRGFFLGGGVFPCFSPLGFLKTQDVISNSPF